MKIPAFPKVVGYRLVNRWAHLGLVVSKSQPIVNNGHRFGLGRATGGSHDVVVREASNIIKMRVGPDAKRIIAATAKRLDMKEQGVAGRIYSWFARQPDVVQKGVLGLLPEGMESEVMRLAMEQMAAEASSSKRPKSKASSGD